MTNLYASTVATSQHHLGGLNSTSLLDPSVPSLLQGDLDRSLAQLRAHFDGEHAGLRQTIDKLESLVRQESSAKGKEVAQLR